MILINFKHVAAFILLLVNIKYSNTANYIVELLDFSGPDNYEDWYKYEKRNYEEFRKTNKVSYVYLKEEGPDIFYFEENGFFCRNDSTLKIPVEETRTNFHVFRPETGHILMNYDEVSLNIQGFGQYRALLTSMKIYAKNYNDGNGWPINLNAKSLTKLYRFILLPGKYEQLGRYWNRIYEKLRDCAKRNDALIDQEEKIDMIDGINSNYFWDTWYDEIKNTQALGTEPMDFYQLRMVNLDKIPLTDTLRKKFYDERNTNDLCNNRFNPGTKEGTVLQIICNCTFPPYEAEQVLKKRMEEEARRKNKKPKKAQSHEGDSSNSSVGNIPDLNLNTNNYTEDEYY